jgi:hypothetical protein
MLFFLKPAIIIMNIAAWPNVTKNLSNPNPPSQASHHIPTIAVEFEKINNEDKYQISPIPKPIPTQNATITEFR